MDRQPNNGSLLQHFTGRAVARSRIVGAPSRLLLASLLLCAAVSLGAVAGPSLGEVPIQRAAVTPMKGKYKGKTSQVSVAGSFRRIRFTVKGRRISLTTEPVIRHGDCLSAPVFIEGGSPPVTKRINSNGTFSFERTFEGSRFHRIKGTFVDERTIEGTARYFFFASASGLCAAGKEQPRFTASR
jgi:hypothetical protein